MGDYNRSTQEMPYESISADVMQAIDKYVEKHNLGDILKSAVLCTISNNEKIKKGLFGGPGPKSLIQVAILTDRWLLLADRVDQNAIYVKSMQLRDITVEDYEKSSFYKMIPDSGVNITGMFTDASEKGTIFLPLGKDAAGDKIKERLIAAVQDAKK